MPMRGRRKSAGTTRAGATASPAIVASPAAQRTKRSRKAETNGEANGELNGVAALQTSPVAAAAALGKRKRGTTKASIGEREAVVEASGVRDSHPEGDGEEGESEAAILAAQQRAPPVNSSILPLPWSGRLGYACLNTYLRTATPPVFSSRTCRLASITEHRHPLQHPDQPEHPTKNRPDKSKPASQERGQRWVQELGLANARDIAKMLRWNERFGIRFLRLSSEMFPFASHAEHGYSLAPFAAETLAEAGKVAAELGHRLTTHPGQYTQLGSPRKQVTDNAVRDLAYHAELLDLLKLPEQADRDAVMILHLGGVFGDREATLERFRTVYATLPANVKKRLVLENDDVSWSAHELLPLCEELNIPLVLDWHHHNIVFDAEQVREGSEDILAFVPRILQTWRRKRITPKMHYSEPCPGAVTGRQRRKHRPRVATLPPCPPDMDLMIEAKDKEQAVFELMRTFRLPGFQSFADMVPHVRDDQTALAKPYTKNELKERRKAEERGEELETRQDLVVADDDTAMGGPLGRVYWPPGMEHWLKPAKRVVAGTPKKADAAAELKGEDDEVESPVANGKAKKTPKRAAPKTAKPETEDDEIVPPVTNGKVKRTPKRVVPKVEDDELASPAVNGKTKKTTKRAPPKAVELETESEAESSLSDDSPDLSADDARPPKRAAKVAARPARARKRVSYVEDMEE